MATDDQSAAPSGDAITTPAIETKAIETTEALKIETAPAPAELKKDELPIIEAPKLAAETPKLVAAETPKLVATETPKLVEAPKAEASNVIELKSAAEKAASLAAEPSAPAASITYAHISRYAPLAASIAIAAAIGVMGGALGASGLLWSSAPTEVAEAAPMPTIVDESRTLHGTLAQLRTELAGLKTSIDAGAKGTSGQLAKLAERIERAERAQAEPTTKITKAIESLERLEKRVDALTAREATGSVSAPQQNAAVNTPQQQQSPTTVIPGWIVRDVYRGTAIVQGRGFGMMEVEAGDTIPGIGRVESIRRQNGHWVVVTSRGLITAAR
jgi:hypothetical protein